MGEQENATDDQVKSGGDASAELGMFHFIFPEDQRVIPFMRTEDEQDDYYEDEDEDEDDSIDATPSMSPSAPKTSVNPASSLPGDADMRNGDIEISTVNDSSDTVSQNVRVQ